MMIIKAKHAFCPCAKCKGSKDKQYRTIREHITKYGRAVVETQEVTNVYLIYARV